MKRWKRTVVLGVLGAVMFLDTLNVSAAGLRDVFDAEYYSDSYEDLKVFGNDAEALFRHYVTSGLSEGRSGSKVFDVVEYRNAYKDLEAIFGDNWDAYVNHYCEHGVTEGRTAGVYGEIDFSKVGNQENADSSTAENAGENTRVGTVDNIVLPLIPSESEWPDMSFDASMLDVVGVRSKETGKKQVGSNFGVYDLYGVIEYDAFGNMIKNTTYADYPDYPEGRSLYAVTAYKYDASGNKIKDEAVSYKKDGTTSEYSINVYDGVKKWHVTYGSDGTLRMKFFVEYNASGKVIKEFDYYNNGNIKAYIEYDASGENCKRKLYYDREGMFIDKYIEYDAAGNTSKETTYNSDGSVLTRTTYSNWDTVTKTIEVNVYDAAGNLIRNSRQQSKYIGGVDQW